MDRWKRVRNLEFVKSPLLWVPKKKTYRISPVNAGSDGLGLHFVFLWCLWHVWDVQGVHCHEFIMSQISKLVDSHFPGVFSVSMLYIVLVDLGQVGGEDTFSVCLRTWIDKLMSNVSSSLIDFFVLFSRNLLAPGNVLYLFKSISVLLAMGVLEGSKLCIERQGSGVSLCKHDNQSGGEQKFHDECVLTSCYLNLKN